MPKEKLPKSIKLEADAYVSKDQKARELTNEANRQKTVLRNAIKKHWAEAELPIGSYIHAAGFKFSYGATETSVIDPAKVFQLYEDEDITKEQFLSMIKISSMDAKNVLGGDQVADFTTTVVGNKADVRVNTLPVEQSDDEFIMVTHNVKKKTTRKVLAGNSKQETTINNRSRSTRLKRKIKLKVSK